jgi:hypothetical protein
MAKKQNRGRGVKKVASPCEQQKIDLIDQSLSDELPVVGGECDLGCIEVNSHSAEVSQNFLPGSPVIVGKQVMPISPVEANLGTLPVADDLGINPSSPVPALVDREEKLRSNSPDVHKDHKGETQDWRNLFKTGKSVGLQFHEPSRQNGRIVIQPPRKAVEDGIVKWSSSLIGQFLDKPLPFYVVKRSVDNLWSMYGSVDVSLLENGLYLFRFADEKTRDIVLEEKLWYIANKPLILRRWVPGMQLLKLSLSSIPIWVKLHNLPLEYWNPICLSHIASGVGKPICSDSVTEEHQRLGFARVLIEVDTNSEFPKEIDILDIEGNVIKIGIEYPWLPIRCKKCKLFGHATHTCSKSEKAIWIPRWKAPAQVEVQAVPPTTKNVVGKPSTSNADQWTVVKAKKTPKSRVISEDNSRHWTNSFQLLARADGRKFDEEAVRNSNLALQQALAELDECDPKDKGKGILEEEGEDFSRGFSPHS